MDGPFTGKLNKTVAQSADVTNNSDTNATDIPGLTVDLPRAGTYHVMVVLPWTAGDSTSRTMGVGLAYSGSTTLIHGEFHLNPNTTTFASQATMGTLATAASQTGTQGRFFGTFVVKVSTSGTLKMQFSRSAASITHTTGVMTVRESE